MGIVKNQSIKNSLFFYTGIAFGAFSTIILYPNVFNVYPEHLGLLQVIVAYSTMISAFSLLGTPKTLIRFFPRVKNQNQLISLSFLIPSIGFLLVLVLYFLFKHNFLDFIKPNSDDLDELKTFSLLKLNFQELEGSISLLESRLENNVKTPIEEIASPIVKKEENSIFDEYKKDPFQL